MSRFRVNLQEPSEIESVKFQEAETPIFASANLSPAKPSVFLKVLKFIGIALILILVIGGIGSFFYWRSVKKTPSYSLAMLVDGARRDDQAQVEKYIDSQAVIEDFMPQVTDKAIELYGRNLPQQTLAKVAKVALPVIPIIKERAEAELPRVIREKTAAVEKVPYWMIALFAVRAVDISIEGDTANIKSKIPERPLELEMKRDGDKWKVTAMKDDVLARKIAEKIGQDIIAAASKGGIKKAAESLGVNDADIIKNAEDIFK
ncbi:MAG: hypothetical protein ACR2L1_01735 [Pyrinomonadaceae bacterium]